MRRYDVQALLDHARLTFSELYHLLGLNPTQRDTVAATGLSWAACDRWCAALSRHPSFPRDVHPAEVWPEWSTDGLHETACAAPDCAVMFPTNGKAHCSRACYAREWKRRQRANVREAA